MNQPNTVSPSADGALAQTFNAAYIAAVEADDAYSAELRRVYGRDACNARYQSKHADAAVTAAMMAKLRADQALHDVWAKVRR